MNQRLNAPSPSEAQRTQKVGNGAPRPARRAPAARTPGQGLREPQVWMASQPQAVGLVSGSTGTMSFLQLGDGLQSLAGAGLSPGPPSIKGQLPGSPPPLHSATAHRRALAPAEALGPRHKAPPASEPVPSPCPARHHLPSAGGPDRGNTANRACLHEIRGIRTPPDGQPATLREP